MLNTCQYSIADIARSYNVTSPTISKLTKKFAISDDCLEKMTKRAMGSLPQEKIDQIKELWLSGEHTVPDISTLVGVVDTTVHKIVSQIETSVEFKEKMKQLATSRSAEALEKFWTNAGGWHQWMKTLPKDKQKEIIIAVAKKVAQGDDHLFGRIYQSLINKLGL